MIKHILKLIWKKKGSNALLLLEIFLSFLVLFAVLSYVTFNLGELRKPLGFDTHNKWLIHLDDMSDRDSSEVAQQLISLKDGLLAMDKVKAVSFTNGITVFSNSMSVSTSNDNGFDIRTKYIRADHQLRDVLNINMLSGRWFSETDAIDKYEPMIVSKNFMDEYYPNKSMIDSIIIFDGEKKVGGGSRNLAAFPATNYLKGSMFLDIKGDGIATAIYKVYLEAVPSGSTLLLGSANKETNIFLDKMLRDSSIDLNDNSTVRKIASQWLTNEIATLSYNEYPVWLKVIEKSGWKLLQIEFLGVSDKGMGLYIFHMQKP